MASAGPALEAFGFLRLGRFPDHFPLLAAQMKKRKAKGEVKITLDEKGRPDKLISESTEQFNQIISRNKAGEFEVAILEVGATNGQWIFHVSYPQPKQSEMFDER